MRDPTSRASRIYSGPHPPVLLGGLRAPPHQRISKAASADPVPATLQMALAKDVAPTLGPALVRQLLLSAPPSPPLPPNSILAPALSSSAPPIGPRDPHDSIGCMAIANPNVPSVEPKPASVPPGLAVQAPASIPVSSLSVEPLAPVQSRVFNPTGPRCTLDAACLEPQRIPCSPTPSMHADSPPPTASEPHGADLDTTMQPLRTEPAAQPSVAMPPPGQL